MKFERIHTLRIEHNLSQTEIANILNIKQRSYSHYETGSRSVPIEVLIALCDYYNVTLDYLVGRAD